jgi:large repetitive protein
MHRGIEFSRAGMLCVGGQRNPRWQSLLRACLGLVLVAAASTAVAEGSRSLYPSTYPAAGFRADLDLTGATNLYAGVTARRQFLYVYATAGDFILLGSSNRANGGNGDITAYNPQSFGTKGNETIPVTANFTCSATTPPVGSFSGATRGLIAGRANELAGPNSADNSVTVTNGYAPCAYLAPSTGIYGVLFSESTTPTTGAGAASAPTAIVNETPFHVGNATVAAWDVSVRASATSTTDINASVFTYGWIGFTNNNGRPLFHVLYYTTPDGVRYQQTLQGLDPNGYALWGSTSGFFDNGEPLYKDIRGNDNVVDTGFPAELSAQQPEAPIFFSTIDPTGPNSTQVDTVLTALAIPLSPPPPQLNNPAFTGLQTGNETYVGGGGTFTFDAFSDTTYQIVVSAGTDFDPANTSNATLTGLAPDGLNSVPWNGLNNSGAAFPQGTFTFQIVGRNGEIHFPIIDAEGNATGGPTLTKLNGISKGDSTVYFDDRGYVTTLGVAIGTLNGLLCPANPPVPPTPDHSLLGVDSSVATAGNFYRFWPGNGNKNTDCNAASGFGDAKGLDLWTYQLSPVQSSTLIINPANFTLVKTGPATVLTNGSLVYTIGVGNSGATISGTTLTVADVLPPGVTYQSAAAGTDVSSVTCLGTTALTCTVNLTTGLAAGAANGAAVFTITTTAPPTPGSIINYASVDPTGGGSPPTPGPTCAPVASCGNAPTTVNLPPENITLAKIGPPTALVNGSLVYTIGLGNSGGATSGTTLTVADNLPAGVTYLSAAAGTDVTTVACVGAPALKCTLTLAAGLIGGASNGAATFTITATAPGTAGSIINYASVDPTGGTNPPTTGPTCTPTSSCGSAPTTINTPPNITLAKAGPASVTAGGSLVYTISLGNSGGTASGTTLSVADVLPPGVTYLSAAAGTNVTTVACTGSSTLACTVTLTAGLAAGAANGAATFTISTTAPSAAGNITNYASVDPTGGGNPPVPGPTCSPVASCGSAPTVVNSPPANITLAKSGPATAVTNGSLVYTIGLGNSGGTVSGTTLTVADVLPAGVTFQSASPGTNVTSVACVGTTTLSCTVHVTVGLAAGAANGAASFTLTTKAPATAGNIVNYASVDPTGGSGPPTPGPTCTPVASCGNAPTTINTPVNITLVKSGPATVQTNGSLVYTIALGNSGQTASGTTLTVSDVLPAGVTYQSATPGTDVTSATCVGTTTLTCTLTLTTGLAAGAANGAATFTLTTKAPATAGNIVNYASVDPTGGASPPTPGPTCTPVASCGNAPTTINTPVNITLVKSGPATVQTNGSLVYTIALGNSGQTASGTTLTVSDVLPAGVTYQSAAPGTDVASVNCVGTTTLTCTLNLTTGLAAASANGAAAFSITTIAPATTGGIINYASVDPTGGTNPPAPGAACTPVASCGNAPTTLTAPLVPVLQILKTGPATAIAGGNITYTITVTNVGQGNATNVVLTDPAPAGLTFVSSGAPCATMTGLLPCDLGPLDAGNSITVPNVVFAVAAGFTGNIVNTATVTSDQTTQTSSSATTVVTNGTTAPVTPTPIDARWMLLAMIALLAAVGAVRVRKRA